MTQFNTYPIQCNCNNIVDIELYDSVNVTVDSPLAKKVRQRQINNFKCNNCGNESELAYRFLYVDMKKGVWIWCYPFGDKGRSGEIEKELNNEKLVTMGKFIEKFGQQNPKIVFGYDELLALI
jgi:hypothetical protein